MPNSSAPHENNESPPFTKPSNGSPVYAVPQAKSRSARQSRLPLLVSVAVSVAFALLLYKFPSDATLPATYALCSKNDAAIYTVDAVNSKVQCVVVKDGRIHDTGSYASIQAQWRKRNSYLPFFSRDVSVNYIPRGAIVLPGLSDSHGHVLEYAAYKLIPIEHCKSAPEVVQEIRKYILSRPDLVQDRSKFIEGWGWDQENWNGSGFPSYKYFEEDPVVSGRPIVFQAKDGHALWVSEKVLRSIESMPVQVEGGVILRDQQGKPTGVFLDDAQLFVPKPPLSYEDRIERFGLTASEALSQGLTSLHDAGFDPASLEFYKRYTQDTKLPVRIYCMSHFNESAEYWGKSRRKIINHNRLTARSVKMFADGALRTGGSALFEPYTDNPALHGFMRIEQETLDKVVPKFIQDGWQVNIHAIGDRANSIILDAFEASLQGYDSSVIRPRIEHAQIIRPKDARRMARLGIIASVQPTHCTADMWYAEERLGPERIKNLYNFRTIIDSGARITLGTDFPVEEMKPLHTFYAAITRVTADGRSPHGPDGWFPDQRLTRTEALRGMTIDPAYASFTENELGSLERGKIADFVVMSRDIMTIPDEEIMDTQVLATAVDGVVVYGSL